jgi:hypothetical protein
MLGFLGISHCDITPRQRIKKVYRPGTQLRRVYRYQRGNQNPYIEEEQTTK